MIKLKLPSSTPNKNKWVEVLIFYSRRINKKLT